MPLRADHMQPAQCDYFIVFFLPFLVSLLVLFFIGKLLTLRRLATQYNIHPTSGHISSHRHGSCPASLADDLSLTLMVPGIEYLVLHALAL